MIFDWGNTLVDYPLRNEADQLPFLHDCLSLAIAETTGLRLRLAQNANCLGSFNAERDDCQVVRFTDRLGLFFPEVPREHHPAIERLFCEMIFECAKPCEGSYDAVQELIANHLRVAVLSNLPWGTSPQLWKGEFQRHLGPLAKEIAFICCGDVGFRKPHQTPFARCVEVLGCPATRILMVGDNFDTDILGAVRFGLAGSLISPDPSSRAQFKIEHYTSLRQLVRSILD